MKTETKMYYIVNEKTDETFDFFEDKFYSKNWAPELTVDEGSLKKMIQEQPLRFKDCIVDYVLFYK
jgi:hypothetical protein